MEDKKIIENDSQLIVGVNEKISCGKAAFLGMQHVLSMDLYIMPLILGAAIGLAGGELSSVISGNRAVRLRLALFSSLITAENARLVHKRRPASSAMP